MALFSMRDSWNVWRRKVNEALGGLVEPVKAEDVTYDNTDSGLSATDIQSAVDEVASEVSGLDGADVAYNNTSSGLSATNVQGAIDETLGVAKDKLNFIEPPSDTNIFTILDAPSDKSIYMCYLGRLNNGNTNLVDVLGIGQYARVTIFSASKYLTSILIIDTNSAILTAYSAPDANSITFMMVHPNGTISTKTVNRAS